MDVGVLIEEDPLSSSNLPESPLIIYVEFG